MGTVLGLIIGIFIGAAIGVFCSALMIATKDRDEYDNLYRKDEENE